MKDICPVGALLICSGVGNMHKMCQTRNVCDVGGDFGLNTIGFTSLCFITPSYTSQLGVEPPDVGEW